MANKIWIAIIKNSLNQLQTNLYLNTHATYEITSQKMKVYKHI